MRLRDGRVVPASGQALNGNRSRFSARLADALVLSMSPDLIDGIFKLAMSDFHEPVNPGNPREMKINKQFADEIIPHHRGKIDHRRRKPLPVDDPKKSQPDISRAKNSLAGNRRVQFDEGIKKTIEYFRESLKRIS